MPDAALIAALGWEPCEVGENEERSLRCRTHLGLDGTRPHVPKEQRYCYRMRRDLTAARAGMDLAREGIADDITREVEEWYVSTVPAVDMARAVVGIARGWGK